MLAPRWFVLHSCRVDDVVRCVRVLAGCFGDVSPGSVGALASSLCWRLLDEVRIERNN